MKVEMDVEVVGRGMVNKREGRRRRRMRVLRNEGVSHYMGVVGR